MSTAGLEGEEEKEGWAGGDLPPGLTVKLTWVFLDARSIRGGLTQILSLQGTEWFSFLYSTLNNMQVRLDKLDYHGVIYTKQWYALQCTFYASQYMFQVLPVLSTV